LRTSERYLAGEDVADRTTLTRVTGAAMDPLVSAGDEPGAYAPGAVTAVVGMTSPAVERLLSLRRLRQGDWTLIIAVFGLCAIGLLMVFSVSQALVPADPWYLLRRQALSAVLGVVALVVIMRVDYHRWQWLALPSLILALALMALTLLIGRESNGAQRWLSAAGFTFQPSEPAKLALVLFLAAWFAKIGPDIRSVRRGLLPFVGATGALAALTLAQRDMGTTVIIIALAFAMYFTAGARPAHLLALLGIGALSLGALATVVSYRRARLTAFLNPLPPGCHDAGSYQVCQGLLSLGSGGALGAGLGASVQKAGYLPFPQTDSIYAVLGGELGLLGCALTIGLLGVVVWRGYRAGRRAPDTFGALLACGIATWLGAQAAINIGGVVAAIPFTGVPLPFISYGGAALVSALAAVGALLNIHTQGAPLRPVSAPRRLPRHLEQEEPAQAPDMSDQTARRRSRPMTGMPLARVGHTWTWSGPSSLAHRRGEEHVSQ
jgi:cell division protein FtsW